MNRNDLKRRHVLETVGDGRRLARCGDLTAGQVMTTAPSCIRPQTNVLELIKLFHAKQFRHLLVTDESERLIGVVSDRDVIRSLGPDRHPDRSLLAGITAAEIMSTDLVTIGATTPLTVAAGLVVDHGISCLPVLTDGALVGILTNTDLHVVLQVLLQTLRWSSLEKPAGAAASSPQN
jgi:acetoin utilization protein AcuB